MGSLILGRLLLKRCIQIASISPHPPFPDVRVIDQLIRGACLDFRKRARAQKQPGWERIDPHFVLLSRESKDFFQLPKPSSFKSILPVNFPSSFLISSFLFLLMFVRLLSYLAICVIIFHFQKQKFAYFVQRVT